MFKFEITVYHKAKSLLISQRFRDLLKFASLFSVALPQLINEMRPITSALVQNWKATFELLHKQFSWDFPSNSVPGSTALRARNSQNGGSLDTHGKVNSNSALQRKRDELR